MAGIGFACLAGVMQGGFPLPMKFARKWVWENIWLASSLPGLVIFPWLIAAYTIPALGSVLASSPRQSIVEVALFGTGWGIGGMLFGLGVHRVGLSLALALVVGLTSTAGCVVPLVLFHPDRLWEKTGAMVTLAVAATLAGLVLCMLAGNERERNSRKGSYWAGISICVMAGLLSPLANFALIRGEPLMAAAAKLGAAPVNAPNIIWAVAMTGGMLPTAVYCGWLLWRNRTWNRFAQAAWNDGLLALLMGALFAFGNAFYGMGAENLGELGAILGWPVFMAVQVLTGSLLGVATGEWKGAGFSAARRLAFGNGFLLIAVFLIGRIGP
jgi:L-rhamnose-H+ transport protein